MYVLHLLHLTMVAEPKLTTGTLSSSLLLWRKGWMMHPSGIEDFARRFWVAGMALIVILMKDGWHWLAGVGAAWYSATDPCMGWGWNDWPGVGC
jgi:hypothetical protein